MATRINCKPPREEPNQTREKRIRLLETNQGIEVGGVIHFWGGLWAKSTPFWMLLFKPLTAASSRVFSLSVMSPRMSMAFSAPLGCGVCQHITYETIMIPP